MYSTAYENELQAVADTLKIPRDWLFNVISQESSWNPAAYNGSGAVGLIQFMPQTLKGMGLLSPSLANSVPSSGLVPEAVKQAVRKEFLAKYPDALSQLQVPVLQYFKGRNYPTEQSVYMQVFYPAYRNAPLTQAFPAAVQAQNPGIDTVGDYVNKVRSRVAMNEGVRKGIPLLALAGIAFAVYTMLHVS